MSSANILRVAAVVSLLFAIGHSLGGLEAWSPGGENDALRMMKSFVVDPEGVRRTYYEFYLGFGWIISVYLVLQALVLWQVATLAKTNPRSVRSIVASFAIANVIGAVLSWWFIFAVPAIFYIVMAAGLSVAFYRSAAGR